MCFATTVTECLPERASTSAVVRPTTPALQSRQHVVLVLVSDQLPNYNHVGLAHTVVASGGVAALDTVLIGHDGAQTRTLVRLCAPTTG